jgi:cardiolipin synthase
MPHSRHPDPFEGDLFVQPFSDSPLDNEQVSENVYLDIISQAEKYVYIFTPYLIIDDQMRVALSLAAKRGVDVRIVTPGIPDKKAVFRVTTSYYQTLIAAGVKIYEYAPGFIHAKSYVCDDHITVVGSINMDFRSLYLHFECGTFMVARELDEAILSIKKDCLEVFEQSRPIMPRESRNFSHSLYDALLRVFSPLI